MELSLTQAVYVVVDAIYQGVDEGFDYFNEDVEMAFSICEQALSWRSLEVRMMEDEKCVIDSSVVYWRNRRA